MSRLLVAQRALTVPGWAKDALWRSARAIPSLDLRFADNKSLVDATTGASLVTHTRASSGTFVGSDGVLRSAVTNLLLRSEEFNDAGAWTKVGTTVSANSITSPNGALTADTLVEDTSTGTHRCVAAPTIANTTVCTVSVFAKAAGRTHMRLSVSGGLAGELTANLSNGTVAASSGATNPTVQSVGDGWYRVSFTTAASTSTSAQVTFSCIEGTSTSSYTGDGTSGLYVWGAQLEQASTVGDYVPTAATINSAPRFDHNPTTGESLGLLVEEARTNLVLNSEDFSAGTWTLGSTTVAVNSAVAPTGNTTADALLETTASTEHVVYATSAQTFTTATHSIYVKPNGRTNVALRFYFSVADWVTTVYDLTGNGFITQSSAGLSSGFSAVSSSIVNAGNGWYRISITATQSSRTTFGAALDLCTSSTPTLAATNGSQMYVGDITKGVYVWGSQLEVGAFPTSYIPTTTATVTRAADVASITGSNFSSWYNQTEGSMYVDGSTAAFTGTTGFVAINNAGNTNRLEIRQGRISPTVTGAGTSVTWTTLSSPTLIANTSYKQAVAFSSASHSNSIAGVLTNISSTAIPAIAATQLIFGIRDSQTAPISGSSSTIKRLAFWPPRLSNEVLQRITQP